MLAVVKEVLREETKLSKDTLILLSVIDPKRNLDNDQIRTIFEDTQVLSIYTQTKKVSMKILKR